MVRATHTVNTARIRNALSGQKELLAALKGIDDAMVDKIAPAGMRGYLRETAKAIKAEIPGELKDARQGINSRFVKRDKRTKEVSAKAGSGVGIKDARKQALAEKASAKRGKRSGVGISANNVHWAILGTGERTRKSDGQSTGVMKPLLPDIVPRGVHKSKDAALAKFRELSKKELVRQVQKRRKKARRR